MRSQLYLLLLLLIIFTCHFASGQTIMDIEGNTYETIRIGKQVWMKENLKVTHFNNNIEIPNLKNDTAWYMTQSPAWCDYNNAPDTSEIYGRLYNWYVVGSDYNVCPQGWHVPDLEDWQQLIDYLGGDSIAGGALKEAGFAHWPKSNIATNSSGFTALPAGFRYGSLGHFSINYGRFMTIGGNTGFWIAMESGPYRAPYYYLVPSTRGIYKLINSKGYGHSIRCIRDEPSSPDDNGSQKAKHFFLFPNPTAGMVHIQPNYQVSEAIRLALYDMLGRQLLRQQHLGAIDLTTYPGGVYYFYIQDGALQFSKKIVKTSY